MELFKEKKKEFQYKFYLQKKIAKQKYVLLPFGYEKIEKYK